MNARILLVLAMLTGCDSSNAKPGGSSSTAQEASVPSVDVAPAPTCTWHWLMVDVMELLVMVAV